MYDSLHKLAHLHYNYLNNTHSIPYKILVDKTGRAYALTPCDKMPYLTSHPTLFKYDNNYIYMTQSDNMGVYEDFFRDIEHNIINQHPELSSNGEYSPIYPLHGPLHGEAHCYIARFLVSFFGFRNIGVHICCYTMHDGQPYFWLAKRSKQSRTFANMWDNSVAGGVARLGEEPMPSIIDIVYKEAAEEASLPYHITQHASMMMELSYCHFMHHNIHPDTMFCYALQLPSTTICQPNDNEVEYFTLMDYDSLVTMLHNPENFKFNCGIIWILLLYYLQVIQTGLPMATYLDVCAKLQHDINLTIKHN